MKCFTAILVKCAEYVPKVQISNWKSYFFFFFETLLTTFSSLTTWLWKHVFNFHFAEQSKCKALFSKCTEQSQFKHQLKYGNMNRHKFYSETGHHYTTTRNYCFTKLDVNVWRLASLLLNFLSKATIQHETNGFICIPPNMHRTANYGSFTAGTREIRLLDFREQTNIFDMLDIQLVCESD